MTRQITFREAILEATELSMVRDNRVLVIGLGVPDPKGIFGTTSGLLAKFGSSRVFDAPTSENALTGIALGASIMGSRPILTHQRVEFSLLGIEQMINQAAKWSYQTGGRMNAPIVFRLIIGRGWGQGPQHSQSLESWFAHIPGLKVVMPSNPSDAKGLLSSSIADNNPVVFLEHRWLHDTFGNVNEGYYHTAIGKASVCLSGGDISIVAYSYMVPQALHCAKLLKKLGVSVEVVDLRSLRPLDEVTILKSVKKTGRLIALDVGWQRCGVAAEVISLVTTQIFKELRSPPLRCSLKDVPVPSSKAIANLVYPSLSDIVSKCEESLGMVLDLDRQVMVKNSDVPDKNFRGPF